MVGPVAGRLPQLQPAAVILLIRTSAGTVSVTTRSPENALGPRFVTVNVHENGMSAVTVAGEGPVWTSRRSAPCACRVAAAPSVAVLLPSEGSVGEVAVRVALLVIPLPAVATVTGMVTVPSA